jgi:diguanylate cyclase (GGDEF)-like protein
VKRILSRAAGGARARRADQMVRGSAKPGRARAAKNGSARIQRADARAHKIIAECSRVLVRASDEQRLLADICRVVVDTVGYRLAWVGLVRHDEAKTIEPVASAGDKDDYLRTIRLSWGENPFGRGPAGAAVRTGKPQAVRDVLTNPNFAAWREQALARGFQVLASLPLVFEGETLGVFGIFADESNALDADELELLSELAHDIAWGMANVRRGVVQQRAELLLRLEHTVTRALADAENLSAAVKSVIRAVCETEGWACGRFLRVDEKAGLLRLDEVWGVPDPAIARFLESSRNVSYARGVGLAGTVWETGRTLWIPDVDKDGRALQRSLISEIGLRGTIFFPVVSDGDTLGVLAFNSREIREPDDRLTRAVRVIGSQLGQFLRRKRAEDILRESEARFRSLTELSSDIYWEQDEQFRFTVLTGTALGSRDVRDFPLFGRRRWEIDYFNIRGNEWDEHIATLEAHRAFHDLELCRLNDAGKKIWLSITGEPVFDASGVFRGYRGVGRDITARKEAEEKVRIQALQQRQIAEFGRQALADTNLGAVLERAVKLAASMLEVEYANVLQLDAEGTELTCQAVAGWPAEWVGQREVPVTPGGHMEHILSLREPLVVEDYHVETRFPPSRLLEFGVRSSIQVPIFGSTGTFGVLTVHSVAPRRFAENEVGFLQSVASVLAVAIERKSAEERLAYLAQFDSLTGLPNRHLFHDRLMHTMTQATRSRRPMALLFIDLDRFKLVNDTQGHRAGDMLLKQAAERLIGCVRASDTVGRFGGDEFGAIVSDLVKPGDASVVAEKVIDALARPFELDGHETFISASVGITLFPGDGADASALIMNADAAMYRAKEQGRNNYQYFTREMNERAVERVRMEAAMRRAIERREFLLHYQPKVDLRTGAVCGLEALLRWRHPEHGLVSPSEFIPVLEDTGLIVRVGEWVMQAVCEQIAAWRSAGVEPPPVAINLSARQFQQKDLEPTVRRILRSTGTPPALIELELTESMLMKDPEAAAQTLQGLRDAGVKLSVDDFGTGYSSLAYLKRFPIDALKIDRAFIRDVTVDPDDAAITLAIISLAHSMKLKVVAEGVETKDQLDFLAAQDCDQMQGFYFARPLPVDECTRTLTEGRCLGRP